MKWLLNPLISDWFSSQMNQDSFKGIEEMKISLYDYDDYISTMCSLRDGGFLSVGFDTVKVWNPSTGQERMTLEGHFDQINGVCQLENNLVATASSDHTIILWDVEQTGEWYQRVLKVHEWNARCVCPLSNGHRYTYRHYHFVEMNLFSLFFDLRLQYQSFHI